MSKILITGGAGYIGSMLCTKLLEAGHVVTAVDLLKYDKGSLNHLYFQKNFKLICEDIRKVSLMKKLIKTEMENAHILFVPLDVEIGLGEDWLQAH